ncbi:Bcr/CflA family efflux MFS transporter [Acetobacterium fimetarium]|uniref:Bcr/CflA family efflux transporter n=1 Tax=Acetobacterium fimetarium TaxID=52691 RepID=A0ABR6WUK2_9FIRM|nr:multidrug effflux MFS transporter [Acetobacterium fimetarium]MBC3804304.1 Bcr/CflA family efflux MFS transporter [Acetobacterium fimetarium]
MTQSPKQTSHEIGTKQTYLGHKGLVAFMALMNMFIPLSTDMYLPALPSMNSYFGSSSTITNLTLSAFFLFYAVGILFWGPLSDKYGRKPILLVGSIIYAASSIACALSVNIYFLIIARILQGIGAGGITSVSMAIVKDAYSGKKRESVLAICQTIAGLAPMIAPIIGGLILRFSDWRGSFWTLALISLVNLGFSVLFQETLKDEDRYNGTLFGSIGRLIVVSKNKSFIVPALIFSISSLPFMGYIAVSSYIYVDYFGLSAQVYSYFFAANALLSIVGPYIYVKFLSNMDKKLFASMIMAISTLSGVLVMTLGTLTPMLFWVSFLLMSLAGTVIRPFSTNLLLDQQENDTGSASSVIGTLFTILGSVGMSLASIPWGNIVFGLGIIITVFSLLSLLSWNVFMKSNIPCLGVKNASSN